MYATVRRVVEGARCIVLYIYNVSASVKGVTRITVLYVCMRPVCMRSKQNR